MRGNPDAKMKINMGPRAFEAANAGPLVRGNAMSNLWFYMDKAAAAALIIHQRDESRIVNE